jgi:phosphatidylglycerophosphate synthase
MSVPPVRELALICGGEGRDSGERRDFRIGYASLVRRLSIRLTWLLLHTSATGNQVTLLAIAAGLVGGALLAWSDFWPLLLGVLALQLSFVLDFSDGEVARYRAREGGVETGPAGAFLDWIGHYYVPVAMIAGLAWGAFSVSGDDWLLLAALVVILGLVRVSYSARDHIMLGLFRDRPELRHSPEFLRVVLARQGGDPERIDPDADHRERRAGAGGGGLLWRRYTTLGQILVFPGLVNLVSLAVVVDLVTSALGGDYPGAEDAFARSALLAVLGVVHLLHQLRAAAQSFHLLRRLR